jgi:mycofactocin precursor
MEPNQTAEAAPAVTSDSELVTETLVEEVSIDGMCGVY